MTGPVPIAPLSRIAEHPLFVMPDLIRYPRSGPGQGASDPRLYMPVSNKKAPFPGLLPALNA